MTDRFDILFVGGGPGGYVGAIRAAQLGLSVAVIEQAQLGGICLNWGCIPTKALLHSAQVFRLLQNAGRFGLSAGAVEFDLAGVVAHSRAVAGELANGVRHLMKKNRITVLEGHGRLLGSGRIEVTGAAAAGVYVAPHIILATGAHPRGVPGCMPDGEHIWTYKEALAPTRLPRSVCVIGGGAIGVEFASFYRTFGSQVTLVEQQPHILPQEDEEIAGLMRQALLRQGIEVLTGATLLRQGHDAADGLSLSLTVADGSVRSLAVERVLVATGIEGNTEGIGLENTRVVVERGHIRTDARCATDEPGVYAIGDVAGPPWLAHKASHEAVLCVEHIAGVAGERPLTATAIPSCIFAFPQVASIGLNERQAQAIGYTVRIGRFPYLGNGKALAIGESEGLVKTIFDAATGELLGAHMIGADVTEMIQGFTVAKNLETTEAELMHTIFPHPTLSEAMHESVLAAYGRALHV